MDEFLVFAVSCVLTYFFLARWYRPLANAWPLERLKTARTVLSILPPAIVGVTVCTLTLLASYDVRDSSFYQLFYVLFGLSWQFLGVFLITALFDLSVLDDVLNLNNRAALFAFTGAFLGVNLIYNGANIGDGPGWWCVVFAGGLGLVAWIALGLLLNRAARIFERITVERDRCAGIRFGAYLLSSGLILGRASAGDWTSFERTVVEFLDGWPVLLLALTAILAERSYLFRARESALTEADGEPVLGSVCWAAVYLAIALISLVLLPPLSHNPLYR